MPPDDSPPRRGNRGAAGPASGKPASGIPAKGAGWGGPANGSRRFTSETSLRAIELAADPEWQTTKAQRKAEMEAVLYAIALDGEHEANRLAAAVRLREIYAPVGVGDGIPADLMPDPDPEPDEPGPTHPIP